MCISIYNMTSSKVANHVAHDGAPWHYRRRNTTHEAAWDK